jgi:hypothetical protein
MPFLRPKNQFFFLGEPMPLDPPRIVMSQIIKLLLPTPPAPKIKFL